MRGKLIAFEGIDGSGKSTQIAMLAQWLQEQGAACYITCEPTDGPIGRLLREYLSGQRQTDDRVLAALFAADRLDHLTCTGGLCARLAKGETVLVDRYYLSSYAYQGANMPLDWVIALNSQSAALQKPDCHLFLDIDMDTALSRIDTRGGQRDVFEAREKLERIAEQYQKVLAAVEQQERVIRVDANREAAVVARDIRAQLLKLQII